MHHQMGVRQAFMDFFDAVNAQHIAIRLAAEFVSTVAGTNGNGQGIHIGVFHK